MATIQDRWHRKNRETGKLERTALYGTGKRYRPHFRDPSGLEVTRAFDRKIDAQRWLDEQTVALVRGNYVHPQAGRVTVGAWAQSWLAGRSHLKPKTLASYQSLLSTRVLPTWERVPLSKVGHSDVVAWVAGMRSEGLSASRTRQAYHVLTSMLDADVRDGKWPAMRRQDSICLASDHGPALPDPCPARRPGGALRAAPPARPGARLHRAAVG